MDNRQSSKLTMFLGARDYLSQKKKEIENLPGIIEYLDILVENIDIIQFNSVKGSMGKTVVSGTKGDIKEKLISITIENNRKLIAYARVTKNKELLKESNFSNTYFRKSSDNELHNRAQSVYNRIQEHLPNLVNYVINESTQLFFQRAISDFVAVIPLAKIEKAKQKQNNATKKDSYIAAEEALENIDAIMEIIHVTKPDIYNEYKSIRRTVNTAANTVSLKCSVSDSKSGEQLSGVTATFYPEGTEPDLKTTRNGRRTKSDPNVIIKRSAEKGGFMVKSMPDGMYKVILSKNGYKDLEVTIAITNGETCKLNITLEPV